jgi:hypothetical protein
MLDRETIEHLLELIRYMGVDETNKDYTEGYCDAVDDIVTMIEDYRDEYCDNE